MNVNWKKGSVLFLKTSLLIKSGNVVAALNIFLRMWLHPSEQILVLFSLNSPLPLYSWLLWHCSNPWSFKCCLQHPVYHLLLFWLCSLIRPLFFTSMILLLLLPQPEEIRQYKLNLTDQGLNPRPLPWKGRVLTTGLPGKSQSCWLESIP